MKKVFISIFLLAILIFNVSFSQEKNDVCKMANRIFYLCEEFAIENNIYGKPLECNFLSLKVALATYSQKEKNEDFRLKEYSKTNDLAQLMGLICFGGCYGDREIKKIIDNCK